MVELAFTWDWGLIVLSYINACMGAWIGVLLLSDARNYLSHAKYYLMFILLASIGFGLCGIWTMHYTGMLAYVFTNVKVAYDVGLVSLSAITPVILIFVGFVYVSRYVSKYDKIHSSIFKFRIRKPTKTDLFHCLIGAIIIGIGVSAMHYIGMAALIINATQKWQTSIIIFSVLFAIIVSFVGLLLLLFVGGIYGQLVSCLVIGLAVCCMHYTGMYAVEYSQNDSTQIIMNTSDNDPSERASVFSALLISTVSACSSCLILILYHIIKFYQHKNTNLYKKRHGNIIIIVNIFGLFYIIFGSMSLFIVEHNAYELLYSFLLSCTFYGLFGSLLIRYILSWYAINLFCEKEKLTWQKIINSNLDNKSSSFFFKNTKRYGNITWLAKRVSSIAVIVALLDLTLHAILHTETFIVSAVVILITFSLIIYLCSDTPSNFNDLLHIFWEMKFIVVLFLLMAVVTVVVYLILSASEAFQIYFRFQIMIGVTIIVIVPIEIILNRYKTLKHTKSGTKQKLPECLKDMPSFQRFIKVLNKELSMETLLFIVECSQWQNHFGKLLQTGMQSNSVVSLTSDKEKTLTSPTNSNSDLSSDPAVPAFGLGADKSLSRMSIKELSSTPNIFAHNGVTFADDMPLSIIVFGYQNKDNEQKMSKTDKIRYCKDSAYLLYQKYILEYSEFAVNISYGTRNQLYQLMGNYSLWMEDDNICADDLISIYNDACNQVYRLLESSYNRFCRMPQEFVDY